MKTVLGMVSDDSFALVSQDIEAGDGTTSVVVIAGALLGAAERLFGPELKRTDRGETSSEQSVHDSGGSRREFIPRRSQRR